MSQQSMSNLQACASNIDPDELRHILRVARKAGVNNDMPVDEVLKELADKYGNIHANVLLGHRRDILDLYDDISQYGYDLSDAIQDFIDGKE